jgi:PAS domain S-box-containing protein
MIGAGLADASGLLPADLPSLLQELAKQPESIVHREVAAGNRMFHQTISMPRGIQNIRIYSVDVTEVKRAEEALKKSEQQFRLLAENARDLVYRVRLQPTPAVEYISPSALALTGHSPEEFLADPALAARILPPEAREAQEMNPKMKGNMGGPVTMSWPRPDGATAWLEMVSHPVLNAAGKLVAVEGVGRDITERKQVEDALRESEEKFRNLAEHSPNMIFINVKGRVVYANHRWEEVMGYTREEFCSPGFDFISVVIAPEYRDAMREKYRKHLSNQDLTPDEHAVIAKDGRRIPVILSTTLIRYGGEMAILGTLTDITELKRSEEKLARLNQQNELVLCSAAEGILGLDLQNDQTFVNPAAARMLGYEVEELLGRHSHSTWHHSKPDGSPYPQEECLINATFLDGAVHRSSTEVFWRKDGTSFPVEYASTPIYEKGRVAGAVVTFADITERKLAEEKIRASLKEKEVLLKEIHHRVKNNLQIISSLLSMQSRRVKDAHILEVLRESQNRVQTMALIHDRIYRSADLSRVDLREYITRLVNELYISYGVDPARVRLDLDLEEVQMEIETAIPCGFIINELVSNCLKHAFHSRKRGALRISLSSGDGGAVRLSVSDDGVGLPRGFDFTKTESLGLQLVCGLVTQLRGTIELGKDAGTEFRIEFRLGEP